MSDDETFDWTPDAVRHATATAPPPDATHPRGEGRSVVAVPLTDVRRDPDPASELVTQALLGTPAQRLAADPGGTWVYVRLPDYEGWMEHTALAAERGPGVSAAPDQYVRVVPSTATLQVINAGAAPETWIVYAGTTLQRLGEMPGDKISVALPDGRRAGIAAGAVTSLHEHGGTPGEWPAIQATAREFLTTPYLWGGMSRQGIDCSGFVQMVYQVHGYLMPRDANQQFEKLPQAVERGAWEPGDLLFFGKSPTEITHVGMYIGNQQVIHASGKGPTPSVQIQSMDPTAPDYAERLVTTYVGARRVLRDA
jgi:cell wall-associated NlpC family hydrolase